MAGPPTDPKPTTSQATAAAPEGAEAGPGKRPLKDLWIPILMLVPMAAIGIAVMIRSALNGHWLGVGFAVVWVAVLVWALAKRLRTGMIAVADGQRHKQ